MNHFLIYDPMTGLVQNQCQASYSTELILQRWPVPSGCRIVFLPGRPPEGASFYVQDDQAMIRQTMSAELDRPVIVADGEAAATVTGLPQPCMVEISGAVSLEPTEVTDGELVITSTRSGLIRLRFTRDPDYEPKELVIRAT